jgi:anti-sigma-K factor RskA
MTLTTVSDARHQHLAELLPACALGALEPDEQAAVEKHLAGCPDCASELAAWRHTAEHLADATPPVTPTNSARERLLTALDNAGGPARRTPAAARVSAASSPTAPPPARAGPREGARSRDRSAPARRGVAAWLAAAAAIAAVVLASWALVRQGALVGELERASAERRRLLAEQEELRAELSRARGRLTELAATIDLVTSPDTRRILLAGLGPAEGATATALVDPHRRIARFTARGLPAPPPGRTYQLWTITAETGPVSAGVFDVDERGSGELEVASVPPPEQAITWAVTVEPAGGVPAPTGEMVLKSQVES